MYLVGHILIMRLYCFPVSVPLGSPSFLHNFLHRLVLFNAQPFHSAHCYSGQYLMLLGVYLVLHVTPHLFCLAHPIPDYTDDFSFLVLQHCRAFH